MAKLTIIHKSRKEFTCMGPGKEVIPAGSEYRRWSMNYRKDHVRCMVCPAPSRSFFTTSEILAMAWDIADQDMTVDIVDWEDFTGQVTNTAEAIREIAETIQEKMSNIESGFGHTMIPAYEELEERMGLYEDWAQEVEDVPNSFDEYDFDEVDASDALREVVSQSPE